MLIFQGMGVQDTWMAEEDRLVADTPEGAVLGSVGTSSRER